MKCNHADYHPVRYSLDHSSAFLRCHGLEAPAVVKPLNPNHCCSGEKDAAMLSSDVSGRSLFLMALARGNGQNLVFGDPLV